MNRLESVITSLIVKYLVSMCMASTGDTVTIIYKHMYDALKPELDKLNVSEKAFRYYWSLVKEQLKDYIVYRCRQRGVTVFKRELCDNLVPLHIISTLATTQFEFERQLRSLEMYYKAYNIMLRKIICPRVCGVDVDSRDDTYY